MGTQPAIAAVGDSIPTQIPLVPGWNLLSFPRPLQASDLNAAFGATPNVTKVMSVISQGVGDFCDVADPDPKACLFAEKVDENWVGTLTTIEDGKAYWASSTSFGPLSVALVDPWAVGSPWPVPVVPGWNLVPIRSLEQNPVSGTELNVDTLFGDISWSTAIGYDASAGSWEFISPDTSAMVKVGQGYWVQTTSFGSIYTSLPVPLTPTPTPVPGANPWGLIGTAVLMGTLLTWMLRLKPAAPR